MPSTVASAFLAHRTRHRLHTLNNYAGRLSAVDGDQDHLLRWSANGRPIDSTAFLRREFHGRRPS